MAEVAKKVYLNQDGTESRSASPEAVALVFKFATGTAHEVRLNQFNESVLSCAAWHGLSQKLGDKFAGKSAEEAEQLFEEALEALSGEAGRWLKERESAGPQTSVVAEALHRVKPDKYPTVAAAQQEVASWSEEVRKGKLAVPALAKMVATVRLERAAAKLDKMKGDEGEADL